MSQPNPDQFFAIIKKIRAAFRDAAEADTGALQPLFVSASDSIETFYAQLLDPRNANADIKSKLMSIGPSGAELVFTLKRLESEASKDPKAAAVFQKLQADIQEAGKMQMAVVASLLRQELMNKLGKSGGLDGLLDQFMKNAGKQDQQPPAPPQPPQPPQGGQPPKKPGQGGGKMKW